jgi:hypothetical protein
LSLACNSERGGTPEPERGARKKEEEEEEELCLLAGEGKCEGEVVIDAGM